MKKAIILLISLGFVFVAAAFYFSESSIKLHKIGYDTDPYEEHNKVISDLQYRLDVLSKLHYNTEDLYYYEDLMLEEADYVGVNECVQNFLTTEEISQNCQDRIIDVIIDTSGEVDFIESIIGYSMNYDRLSLDYNFPYKLFQRNTPLESRLVLSFLNRYRDPIKLEAGFKAYKEHFYERFPRDFYYKFFDSTVSALIEAYDKIEAKEDKEAFFEEIYYKAESQDRLGEYWTITFWKRRSLEKNDTIVYKILMEIKDHY